MTTSVDAWSGMSNDSFMDPADRRLLLLDAARRVVARQGIRRMRMEDIAHEAGVSVGLPYRHFAGRDELVAALLDHLASMPARTPSLRGQSALMSALSSGLSEDPDARITARAWGELYAEARFDAGLRERLVSSVEPWIDEVAAELATETGRPGAEVRPAAERLVALAEGVLGWWELDRVDAARAHALLREAALATVAQLEDRS